MDFRIIHKDSIASTNDLAFERIDKGIASEGDVIWTDEQAKGRGYGLNRWESEKGKNLTFSIILRPRFIDPAGQFVITQMISLALIRFLRKYIDRDLKIKWPNDVYADNEKIAGILIQNILAGNVIEFSVVGIGLNVNQEKFVSGAPNPVSMIRFTGAALSLEDLLGELLTYIGGMYKNLYSSAFIEELSASYLDNLFRYRHRAKYMAGGKVFRAMITGIGPYGQLKLKKENGKEQLFGFKEVEFVL